MTLDKFLCFQTVDMLRYRWRSDIQFSAYSEIINPGLSSLTFILMK